MKYIYKWGRKIKAKQCKCIGCSKLFLTSFWARGKYCSPKCANRSLFKGKPLSEAHRKKISKNNWRRGKIFSPKIKKNCLACKKEFFIPYKFRNARFCSRKCAWKFQVGKNSHLWKGGKRKHTSGYVLIHKPNHPFCDSHGCVFEHRLIIEKHLRRYLKPKETPHHINEIKDDNRIKNFIVFKSRGYHTAFHRWGYYNPKYIIFDGRRSKMRSYIDCKRNPDKRECWKCRHTCAIRMEKFVDFHTEHALIERNEDIREMAKQDAQLTGKEN